MLEDVKGVRLIVTPQDLVKDPSTPIPSVRIDGKPIAWDKGPGNGVISEDALLKALVAHGAEELE